MAFINRLVSSIVNLLLFSALTLKFCNDYIYSQAELKGISRPNLDRMDDMRMRAEELKSAREEKRQKVKLLHFLFVDF